MRNFQIILFPVLSCKMKALWRNVTQYQSVIKHLGVNGTLSYRGQGDNDVKKNSKIVNFIL